MSKAKELYDEWLDIKTETVRWYVKAYCCKDTAKLENFHTQLNHNIELLLKKSREIFKHDEARIKERNETIKYLQDRLAEKVKS